MKIILILTTVFILAVSVFSPAIAANCENADLIFLTQATIDADQPVPVQLEEIAANLEKKPEFVSLLRKFRTAANQIGYSTQLSSYVFQAYCRGADMTIDFASCDPEKYVADGADWTSAMSRSKKCVMSLAGGGK